MKLRTLSLVVTFCFALVGCGGADETTTVAGVDTDALVEQARNGELDTEQLIEDVTADISDGDLTLLGSDRPDWLPPFVLMPAGLNVTFDLHDESTGESSFGGFITGDQQTLYDQAAFMVQTGGYIIEQQDDNGRSKTFFAAHTSDGTVIRFGVAETVGSELQWSMEFGRQ